MGYWDLVKILYPGSLQIFSDRICVYGLDFLVNFFFESEDFVMAGVQVKEGEYTTTVYGMVSYFCVKFIVIK